MQVFKHSGQTAYSYQIQAKSTEDATETGKAFSRENPEQWGEFCYARPVRQQCILLNEKYVLQPNSHFRYRKEMEELNAPFDYIEYSGPQRNDLKFPLTWIDPSSGGTVRLDVWFNAGKSFKFLDLCRNYLAKFILDEGQPKLQFVNLITYEVFGEIELTRQP
jgi:hypothetical protein